MAPSPTKLWVLAESVRDAVIDGYADADVDLPEHRLITPGVAAWDCAGLYVQLERTYGTDGNIAAELLQPLSRHAGHTLRAATFGVTLLRCVPVADDHGDQVILPSVAAEEAAALEVLRDAQLLVNVLVAAERAGTLAGCHGLVIEGWSSVGPDGGLAGGVLRVRLATWVGV